MSATPCDYTLCLYDEDGYSGTGSSSSLSKARFHYIPMQESDVSNLYVSQSTNEAGKIPLGTTIETYVSFLVTGNLKHYPTSPCNHSIYPLILHPALIVSGLWRIYPLVIRFYPTPSLRRATVLFAPYLQRRIFVRGWRTKIRPGQRPDILV